MRTDVGYAARDAIRRLYQLKPQFAYLRVLQLKVARSIDVGYAARVSLDKARNGYKGFKAQKTFRMPDGKCLADAPPKAFKHYLPFVLVAFLPF